MEVKYVRRIAHILVISVILSALSPLVFAVMFDMAAPQGLDQVLPYQRAISDTRQHFFTVIVNSTLLTLNVTLCALALAMVLGTLMSFALHYFEFPGRRALWFLIIVIFFLPTRFYYIELTSLFTQWRIVTTSVAQILIFATQALPMVIILMYLQMRAQPKHILEWHTHHQKSPIAVLCHGVLIPLKTGVASVAIVVLIPMWNDLWVPLLFFGENTLFAPAVLHVFGNATWFHDSAYRILLPALVPSMILYGLFVWSFHTQMAQPHHDKEPT